MAAQHESAPNPQPRFQKKFTARAKGFLKSYAGDLNELNALINQASDSLFPQTTTESKESFEFRQLRKTELYRQLKNGGISVQLNGKYRAIFKWVASDHEPDTGETNIRYVRLDNALSKSHFLQVDIRPSDKQNLK